MTTAEGLAGAAVSTAPFIAAFALYAISPEVTATVRARIQSTLEHARRHTTTDPSRRPPHLSDEYVGDYIEYAIDAAQVIPTIALAVIGGMLVLQTDMGPLGVALVFIVVIPGLVGTALKVLLADPIRYVATKYVYGRYSLLPVAGMVLNALAVLAIVVACIFSGCPEVPGGVSTEP